MGSLHRGQCRTGVGAGITAERKFKLYFYYFVGIAKQAFSRKSQLKVFASNLSFYYKIRLWIFIKSSDKTHPLSFLDGESVSSENLKTFYFQIISCNYKAIIGLYNFKQASKAGS